MTRTAPLQTALKHLGAWGLVLIFVGLLTVVFSFLGTLFCAAMGGLMMGATRVSKRLAVSFSLLCPGILLMTLRLQRSELPGRQVVVLAELVLGAFWALYLVARVVAACEQKQPSVHPLASPAQPAADFEAARVVGPAAQPAAGPVLRLTELEGKWRSENSEGEGSRPQRVLEIRNGSLALGTVDAQGQVFVRGRARMELVDVTGPDGLPLSNGAELAAGI